MIRTFSWTRKFTSERFTHIRSARVSWMCASLRKGLQTYAFVLLAFHKTHIQFTWKRFYDLWWIHSARISCLLVKSFLHKFPQSKNTVICLHVIVVCFLSDPAHWRHGERDRRTSAGVWGQKPQTVPSHRLLLLTRAERRRQAGCHGSALIYMQKLSRDARAELGQDCDSGAGGHVTLSLILFTVNTNLSSADRSTRRLMRSRTLSGEEARLLTCSAANRPISDKTLRVQNNNRGFLAFKGCVAARPYLITFKRCFI